MKRIPVKRADLYPSNPPAPVDKARKGLPVSVSLSTNPPGPTATTISIFIPKGKELLTFWVGGVARAKQSFRIGASDRGGYQSARIRDWQEHVAWAAKQERAGLMGPVDMDLCVELVFCLPDRRRIDIDNLSKAVLDACNGLIWQDDRQIIDLHVQKMVTDIQPGVMVRVWEA